MVRGSGSTGPLQVGLHLRLAGACGDESRKEQTLDKHCFHIVPILAPRSPSFAGRSA